MDDLYKKGLVLEYFTVIYNIFEAIFSIIFGSLSNSIALIGFGLDSIVESLSGIILIWRLKKHGFVDQTEELDIEKKATKLVGLTFFILGFYVLVESLRKLITIEKPDPSAAGIIIAIASLLIMPFLFYQKNITGNKIGSKALIADSKETLACAFLSLPLFFGLTLNYFFGFWQADPIVGIIIFIFLVKEGIEIIKGVDVD
ncbi:MAG: Cation efflux family protein [Candidatus Methanofastidiosum methylothiophilum]|uniref:Cation efflux family protein n=1 Tax=Candidatus Methanofastidiosum methylothiophilum TaxID=1705564 RepID=A0A150IZ20_9EURY|nr:MAG: Cation efflux family protein [Candidatus Methanofastidiosum methylthiophilus]KYC47623.1 MAG: Cation efflux family protein [Candidatus Methanofastidiosum methylthiophilus]KYC50240.1 MAG: Cation efflux family protein [Candidatus Methanofastidiosum methylthiophilus]